MRVNAQEEKRKHGITCHTSSPLEKGRAEGAGWMCLEEAPFYAVVSMTIVQSATPYRQRKRSREIFVIRGLTVNDWKFQTGNLLSTYLRASPHIYCSEAATTTQNPEPRTQNPEPRTQKPLPFLKTLHEKPLSSIFENVPKKAFY